MTRTSRRCYPGLPHPANETDIGASGLSAKSSDLYFVGPAATSRSTRSKKVSMSKEELLRAVSRNCFARDTM